MPTVQVNYEAGEPFTKILSGETAAQAIKRLRREGILENSDGLALADDDHIRVEEAPYIFKSKRDEQHDKKKISLKMGRKEFQVNISHILSLDELTQLAQTTFETTAALALRLVETGRQDLQLSDDQTMWNLKAGAKISATSLRVGFSDVKDDQKALQMLGFGGDKVTENDEIYAPFELDVPEVSQGNHHVRHSIETIKNLLTLVPFPQRTECSARLYIDPILIAAANLEQGLEMSVEEMCESPLVRGPLDYLFHYKLICVCVAEGKKDSITHGIAQNFAQLSAVRYNRRKRKRDESPEACYGIATTFNLWVFTRVDDTGASISRTYVVDPEDPASIRKMIIRVMLLLRHCKAEVDEAITSKTPRT